MWEPVGPLHASIFDEQISEASPVSNSSVPGCTSADRGRVRRSPPTSNPFCLSFDRVFFPLFAVKMSSDCFEPSSFSGLASHLATLSDPQRIVYFRQLDLLPSHAICGKCQAQTVLDVPDSDNHKDRKRFTSCKQTLCSRIQKGRRTIFFKQNTIFENFAFTDMVTIVMLIFCFSVMCPAVTASVIVGRSISTVQVARVYDYLRQAVAGYNRKHHRGKMGGLAEVNESAAVNDGSGIRNVLEYDECW